MNRPPHRTVVIRGAEAACCVCAFVSSARDDVAKHLDAVVGLAFVVGLAHGREARERGVALCVEHTHDLDQVAKAFAARADGPLSPSIQKIDLTKPAGST